MVLEYLLHMHAGGEKTVDNQKNAMTDYDNK